MKPQGNPLFKAKNKSKYNLGNLVPNKSKPKTTISAILQSSTDPQSADGDDEIKWSDGRRVVELGILAKALAKCKSKDCFQNYNKLQ